MRTRSLLLSLLLATSTLAGCAHNATGPQPVNVAAVRASIKESITAAPGEAGPRRIVSMGAVSTDRAQVYTDASDGRREETWVKGPSGWALSDAKVVAKQ